MYKNQAIIISLLISILCLAFAGTIEAQEQDTKEIDALNEKANVLFYTVPDEAHLLSSKALLLSKKLDYKAGIVASGRMLGLVQWRKGIHLEATKLFLENLELARSYGFDKEEANILGNLGLVYGDLGLFQQGLDFHKLSIEIHKNNQNIDRLSASYINAAEMCLRLEMLEEAEEYLENVYEQNSENTDLVNLYYFAYFGELDYLRGNIEQAITQFDKAEPLADKTEQKWAQALIHYYRGLIADEKGDVASSREHYLEALEAALVIDNHYYLIIIYDALRQQYVSENDFDSAWKYTLIYEEQLSIFKDSQTIVQVEDVVHSNDLDTAEDHAEILSLKNQGSFQLIIILIGSTGILMVTALAITIFNKNKRLKIQNDLVTKQATTLKESNEKAIFMAKELDSFAHTVSNNLQSPLWRMHGAVGILQEDKDEANQERMLELMDRSITGMTKMVDDILHLSRSASDELVRSEVDLSRLVKESAYQLSATFPELNIEFDIEPDLKADADGDLVAYAIENILRNAIKFSCDNPVIKIKFGKSTCRECSAFSISDNGRGIPEKENNPAMFEPFVRLSNSEGVKGNGIGLATVKRIINRHEGCIWADINPDGGSTFHFCLDANSENITV
jgi:signal transduction histidine kinase